MAKLTNSYRHTDGELENWNALCYQGSLEELDQMKKSLVWCQGDWQASLPYIMTSGLSSGKNPQYSYHVMFSFQLVCDATLFRLSN